MDVEQGTVLTPRALNRAALHRQLLLSRSDLGVLDAIDHLVGLNAQIANPPYLSLWSRLADFGIGELTELVADRRVVRSATMRSTLHMHTATDYVRLRPVIQHVLTRVRQGMFGKRTIGVDLVELLEAGRQLIAGKPRSHPELRDLFGERWPDRDAQALAYSVHYLLPLVHVPPAGTWNTFGKVPNTHAEAWLGRELETDTSPDDVIMRYLAAFGPATVMDIQAWSGMTRLRAVIDGLRPNLRVFRSEGGVELFDVEDGPLPGPDVKAPPRFLPEFDNLITGYADRTRVMTDEHRKVVCVGASVLPTFLVDGIVSGSWRFTKTKTAVTLAIRPFVELSKKDKAALVDEGNRLVAFAAADAPALAVEFDQG